MHPLYYTFYSIYFVLVSTPVSNHLTLSTFLKCMYGELLFHEGGRTTLCTESEARACVPEIPVSCELHFSQRKPLRHDESVTDGHTDHNAFFIFISRYLFCLFVFISFFLCITVILTVHDLSWQSVKRRCRKARMHLGI